MLEPDATFVEIVELLRANLGPLTRSKRITMDTTLFVDLALWGDDAVEFLHAFGGRWNVDLSMLLFDRHFLPEGYGCLELLLFPLATWRRFLSCGRKNARLIPITLRQLVEAVNIGRWPAQWSQNVF
jgi:hypothetical protein